MQREIGDLQNLDLDTTTRFDLKAHENSFYICITYCNAIRALNLSILISDTFLFKVDQNACNRAIDLYIIFSCSIALTHIRTSELGTYFILLVGA